MDNLLRFRPEPFPELDVLAGESGFDSLPAGFGAEGEDLEAGLGRRRKSKRAQTARRLASVARVLKPLARPIRPLPIPFVPLRPLPIPVRAPDPAADDSRRADRAGAESSGSPSASPAAPEPASEHIGWVQDCLNRVLGLQLPVDGLMGRQTRSALRIFQAQWGLPISGLLGPDTEAALKSAVAGRRFASWSPAWLAETLADAAEAGASATFGSTAAGVWRSEIGTQGSQRMRWIQHALNRILGWSLATDGVIGPQTRSALRRFQQREGLVVDGVAGPATLRALRIGLARADQVPGPDVQVADEPRGQAMDWTRVPGQARMAYIMRRLIGHYGLSEQGAAGLVGNLWVESGCIPNRIEGSRDVTPMTARDFHEQIRTFSAGEIASRSQAKLLGPKLAGVGLAQWTMASRRTGLFQHEYAGRRPGSNILFDMDAQIDYLITELRTSYSKIYRLLCDPGVTVDEASDEVMYHFESPGEVHGQKDPVTGRSPLLQRDDPRLERVFRRRRPFGWQALAAYRSTS